MQTEEEKRLLEARNHSHKWRKWGPYLSERQWGSVREDYSSGGNAWEYLTHDEARSRAYRWGEDGIGGISDEFQQLCFAIALWNGKDPILKERLFGLTSDEGNHGEDVKEYYFYLDNVPSHSYMKCLYKYPQSAYPYSDLVDQNQKRTRKDFEYELLDTAIFDENRYFDVFIEYAKEGAEDLLIQITVANRGKEKRELHLLPTLWFRNTWDWTEKKEKPSISLSKQGSYLEISHPELGSYFFYSEEEAKWLFTENETNKEKLFSVPNNSPYVKDSFHEFIVHGNKTAINPKNTGTKATPYLLLNIEGEKEKVICLRLSKDEQLHPFGDHFSKGVKRKKQEADEFYKKITPFPLPDDMRNVQRQAFAGMLWNKQFYHYNVGKWLKGDPTQPAPPQERKKGRNEKWGMLDAADIFSMPDKWEYPWFAAWDLAFHTVTLAMIDPDFAKHQLLLLTKEWYMHPNGQLPAYEWDFGDVNPPVHAWAAHRVYQIEEKMYGKKDREFLEKIYQKLILNFTWWVNRKDAGDRNIFEGGFLGLDNIGPFDRSKGPLSGTLSQVDGTSWMGMLCLNLLQISLELALDDRVYEDMATKFFEHFVLIADAMNSLDGNEGLWNDEQGFYFGSLKLPTGEKVEMNSVTLIGITPLFAVATSTESHPFEKYRKRFKWYTQNRTDLIDSIVYRGVKNKKDALLLSLASPEKMKKILEKVLDETQLLSPFGIRSVSQKLKDEPFVIHLGGEEFRLDYEPAESTTDLFGGNSNWRGPVWFPLNYLLIESLQKYHYYLGDTFKVECPKGSGKELTLWEVSRELSLRLIQIFLKSKEGRRPVYGGMEKFQSDPHFQDYILFHEYFHGDNGAGLGASNQTGWTGLVAKLIQQYGEYSQEKPITEIEEGRLGNL